MRNLGLLLALLLPACQGTTYEFAPVPLGADEGPAPRPRSDGQYLRALYADLVGRAPQVYDFTITDPQGRELSRFPIDEQQTLLDIFDGLSDPAPLRTLLAAGLVVSAEAHLPKKAAVGDPEAFIAEQFRRLLGREPGVYELHAFAEAWRAEPQVGPATIVRALLGSREYQSF